MNFGGFIIFYLYISSIIIYLYYCNHFYKDPPRLYTSPTTKPHENETENKEDKKIETQSQQTKIAHQREVQVHNIFPTKLVDTTTVKMTVKLPRK